MLLVDTFQVKRAMTQSRFLVKEATTVSARQGVAPVCPPDESALLHEGMSLYES